jgi:plastocyanin
MGTDSLELVVKKSILAGLLLGYGLGASAATVVIDVQDGAGKPLSDAVVFLESPEAARATRPLLGAQVAQEGKTFVPEVLAVTRGTEVSFPNRDKVRHQVYSFSPAKKFELKLYAGTPSNPVLFDQPGVVVLGCNIHDNMIGWILVLNTPYFGSSKNGRVSLDNVPPGNYQLRTWHAGLPVGAAALEQALTVGAGNATSVVRMTGLTP